MKKQKIPKPEVIEAKKAILKEKVQVSKERAKMGVRVSPIKEFLENIKEIVKDALENGVSYTQLKKDIYDVYSFKISEQTIRAYAHNVLGISKRSAKQKSTISQANETVKKSSSEIKKEMARSLGDEL